ncbi:MAG TPA: DUF3347 domain-containing protein [Ignavibacteria bacterium]|nr:DUF3347 domain-containing protein [Ignavibacteria bacterium]
MRITILNILLFIFLAGSLKAEMLYSPADSTVVSDTLKSRFEIRQLPHIKTDSETETVFEGPGLAPQNVRVVFNDFFKQYLAIKDALVYNDSYSAVRNTVKLLDDMRSKSADIEILSKDDIWIFFMSNYDNIRKKAESATFIAEQRFLFNEITSGLKTFIKQYGLFDKTIYLMQNASDSVSVNAEWLSDKRDEKNPYLGLMKDTSFVKVKEVWKFK